MSDKPQRTPTQNNSLQLWCRQAAKVLNEQGVELPIVLDKLQKRGVGVMWDEDNFKNVFRTVLGSVYEGVESTADAKTDQYDTIYQGLCKWFAQEEGATLPPWPDRFGAGE